MKKVDCLFITTLSLSLALIFISAAITNGRASILMDANAATNATTNQTISNASQGAKSSANKTGETAQSAATNASQGAKSLGNKTGEAVQRVANTTGKVLGNLTEGIKGLIGGGKK